MRRHIWGNRLWSPSYFAGSAGGAPLSVVKDCINGQRHRSLNYQSPAALYAAAAVQ